MAEGFGELIIVYNLLPELAAKLDKVVGDAVNKAAFDIQATAQATTNLVMERRTGFLVNSIYTVVGEEGGEPNLHPYSANQPPEEGQELLPEVEKPPKHQAIVAVGANYGVYLEFGTVHMSARPYLTPAAEFVRPKFVHALEKMEEFMAAL